jgi:hypothetical protein
MAKRVFFSFHYQDVSDFRANVVRNHWKFKPNREVAGFFDASIWETAKKTSDIALKRLINSGLTGTSSTCVLIGTSTYLRRWVRYEIMRSFKKGNSICGVHINSIPGKDGKIKPLGENPFDYLGVQFSASGLTVTLYEWKHGEWQFYNELDGSASYRCEAVDQQFRGEFFQLSSLKPVYDWVKNNGYSNFAKWV